jgi:type I restriction enzyme M protein
MPYFLFKIAEQVIDEINVSRHFYKPTPLRSIEAIRSDMLVLEKEAEGLLDGIVGGAVQ